MDLTPYSLPEQEYGHFYGLTPEGKTVPAHEIVGVNGRVRAPDMRDIKKCNLKGKPITLPDGTTVDYIVKSVTSLDKLLAKQGLKRFIDMERMLAQERIPRGDRSNEVWLSDINHESGTRLRAAGELGTRFHTCMETDVVIDIDADLYEMVTAARHEVVKLGVDIIAREQPFVCREYCFGGTVDVLFDDCGILDWKTRTSLNVYTSDCRQIVAYGVGTYGLPFLDKGRGISVIASTTTPGEVLVKEWSSEELNHHWIGFLGLLDIWRAETNYHG